MSAIGTGPSRWHRPTAEVVLQQVEADARASGNTKDLAFFLEHKERFERTMARIGELVTEGGRVLDVGSHFLHCTIALHLMGYQVAGIDVGVFAEDGMIRARAKQYGIDNQTVDRLDQGDFLPGSNESFDAVVFTEILEHITFNPVRFWRRIYGLLPVGGLIYITTPNSLTLWKMLHILKRMIALNGIGLSAPEIFYSATYGHHWKEYAAPEVRDYFNRLSPDFSVEIRHFNYRRAASSPRNRSFKGIVRRAVQSAAAVVPAFRDQLEAIVRVTARTKWLVEPPSFT